LGFVYFTPRENMTLSLEGLKVGAAYPNVVAFLRVIRERESGQGPDAYLMVNGGGRMDGFQKHPWENVPTTRGARACGAYQFLGTTWGGLCRQYEFADFGPESQDLGAIALIQERGALQDVIAGRFEAAVGKLRSVWTSLPGASESSASWTMDKARAVFLKYGGRLDNDDLIQPAAPIEDHSPTNLPPVQQPETPMPAPLILGLISAFGPMIVDMIPAVAKLFDRKAETPEKLTAAQAVISTIVSATSSAGIDEALVKVQSNPALLETVKAKVLAEPAIAQYLTVEIGGGVAEARKADVAQQANEKPFYKTSAVFWISMLMLPMVYWYVGSSVVGGVEVPADWPWYAQVPLKMFGSAWDSGARVGLANLIVGLILGGICGVYYGISVTQNKQSGTPAKEQA
jgi:muramidase (phage lysozyme)